MVKTVHGFTNIKITAWLSSTSFLSQTNKCKVFPTTTTGLLCSSKYFNTDYVNVLMDVVLKGYQTKQC